MKTSYPTFIKSLLSLAMSTLALSSCIGVGGAMAQTAQPLQPPISHHCIFQKGTWSLGAGTYQGNDKASVSYTTPALWSHALDNSSLNLNMEFELGAWEAGDRYHSLNHQSHMWQATVNPMFNWEFNNNFFLQAGIGLTRFSENDFANKQFGSKVNFSDNLGFGYKFNPNTSLTYRISHYSNLGIEKPNPGIEMQQIMLSHRF